ncbi:hypothetical protein SDC9_24396 [bioreactor metagenome]|uniref:Uncharacterized protein n=1 Tax=bioreactor metagenome TaxID=1076179 RepID=A0A644UHP3_9ZZZZ
MIINHNMSRFIGIGTTCGEKEVNHETENPKIRHRLRTLSFSDAFIAGYLTRHTGSVMRMV